MYKFEDMVKVLNRAGFYKSSTIDNNVTLFLKGKDNKPHALILVENFGRVVSSGYGIRRLLELAEKRGLVSGDVMLLVVDACRNKALSHLNNVIYMDIDTWHMSNGHMDSLYRSDLADIKRAFEVERKEALYFKDKSSFSHTCKNHKVVITYILMVATIILYGYTGKDRELYGISRQLIDAGERYRLFTYMFAHASIFHLVSNISSLFIIGRALEKQIGSIRFFVVYVISGIAGAFTSIYLTSAPEIQTVGASGAICGLIAANVVCGMFLPKVRRGSMVIASLSWLAIIMAYGTVWGADNLCHAGGAVGGAVMMLIFGYSNGIIYESELLEATKAHYGRLSELKSRMYTRNASRNNSLIF